MNIPINELKDKVTTYLLKSGFNEQDARSLTDLVVEQELVDNVSSNNAEVVVTKPAMKLIKGNGRPAPLITADYLDEVVASAKQQGIYALGIYDSTYNDFFDVFCRRIAAQDCISIIVENGGPQGVVPFGGRRDITGTNPIAYGIPTSKYPIVFDAATAMHAYGRIRQSKENGEKLPDNAYVDKEGNITTDPNVAHAVLPFGGFKGYAINLLIEVLTTTLVRTKSGLDQPADNQRNIGTFIIVIDPAAFGDISEFKVATTKLADDILAVTPVNPDEPVRVPGFRGAKQREAFLAKGEIEIDDEGWHKFSTALEQLTKEQS